eukprot:scaffold36690_cov30-Tisochrysis_lutea.AAC.3
MHDARLRLPRVRGLGRVGCAQARAGKQPRHRHRPWHRRAAGRRARLSRTQPTRLVPHAQQRSYRAASAASRRRASRQPSLVRRSQTVALLPACLRQDIAALIRVRGTSRCAGRRQNGSAHHPPRPAAGGTRPHSRTQPHSQPRRYRRVRGQVAHGTPSAARRGLAYPPACGRP